MKISLLLLCCLLISVNCQNSCSYEHKTELSLIVGVPLSVKLECNFIITSISVAPRLPTGIEMNTAIGTNDVGTISGTASYASAQSSYTVSVGARGSSQIVKVIVKISVIDKLTKCSYNVGTMLFMINYPNSLLPPTCDSVTVSFTSSNLPNGLEIDPKTGAIYGTAAGANPGNNQMITVEVDGVPQGGKATISLTYNMLDPSSSPSSSSGVTEGILARFSSGQTAWSASVYPTYMKKFDDGSINHYTNVFETTAYSCADGDPCVVVGPSHFNMYGKWTAALNFAAAGDYVFNYRSDDNCAIYIDDMSVNKGEPTPSWNVNKTYTMAVNTPGYHAFTILHYNGGGAGDLDVKWKVPGSEKLESIPKSSMRYVPSPFTKLEYPAKYYSLNAGASWATNGVYLGYCPRIDVSPDLSNIGLSVAPYGRLTTSAAKEYKNGAYEHFTFKCKGAYSGYNEITYILNIRVVKKSKEYAIQGLLGNYYKIDGTNCKVDVNSNSNTKVLTIQKITTSDSDMWHGTSNEIWDGLPSDFANDYFIHWEGYVYVETAGAYMFTLVVQDAGRLHVLPPTGSWITLDKICSFEQNDFSWNLVAGLNYFAVKYIKYHTTPLKTLEVYYSGPGVSKKLIPNSAFYHMPSLSFEYEYLRNDYVSGVEMTPNCPLFVKTDEGKYKSFTVSPTLPQGIEMDPTTGCIKGTPSVSIGNFSLTTFNIKACESQGSVNCLETSVSIEAHAYEAPSGLNYPNSISGEIGMQVILKPTYVSNTAVKWSSDPALPKGLSFDVDGTIRGNPVEVYDKKVTISCSNPSGSTTYELSISIRSCSSGNFVYLKYITGDADVSVTLSKVNSQGTVGVIHSALPKDHTFNTFYSKFSCSEVPDIKLEINFDGQLGGTYILGGEDDVIFRKGSWDSSSPSSAIQISIEKGDTPELSYRSKEYTYVIGEDISIYPNPVKYGAASFSVDEGSLPLGVLFNTTTGEFYGYAIAGAESKEVTVTAKGRGGLSSSTATVSFIFNDLCPDGYNLLTLEGIMTDNGENQMMQLTGPSGVVVSYDNGFRSYDSIRFSQCLPVGSYTLQYGIQVGKSGRSGRWYVYKNNVQVAYYDVVWNGRVSYVIDLFTYIDAATQWEYSNSASGSWHSQYGNGGWNKCTINSLPSTTSATTYYRAKFSLAYVDFASISRFELTLKYKDGIVVWLNGEQLYIRNMGSSASDTTFGDSVFSTSAFSSLATRTVYGSNQRLNQGDNYIGIEIHRNASKSGSNEANEFSASLSLSSDAINSCQNTIPLPTESTRNNFYNTKVDFSNYGSNEGFAKAFDSDLNTRYTQDYRSGENPIVFRYWVTSGGAVTVDQYAIATPSNYPCRDPYSWTLEGARQFDSADNEGQNPFWETIATVTDGLGYSGNIAGDENELPETRKKYYYFPPTTTKKYAYEALRFTINGRKSGVSSCSDQIHFAEFNTLICRQMSCPQDGLWPITLAGATAEIECDAGYLGYKTRKCLQDGTWDSEISEAGCLKKQDATQLNYDFINPVRAYVGANVRYTPNPNGEVTGYSVSPRLPTGLSLDANTGVIKGAPTEKVESGTYTITATTYGNPVSQTLMMTITQPSCSSQEVDGVIYPETLAGNSASVRCGGQYSGSATVTCSIVGTNAAWATPDRSKCLPYPPPGCKDITDMTFKVGDTVNKMVTCVNGIANYTITPSLPTGISLTAAGTVISFTGIASVALSPTTYLLNVTSTQRGYDELYFPLKIYEPIKSCSYAFGNSVMQIGQNIETEIYAPTCIGVVDSYVLVNENQLPAGLKFNKETGSITGVATTLSMSPISLIMNAVNPAGSSPQYTLMIQVVEAIMDDGKLDGEITGNGEVQGLGIAELKRKWEAGDFTITRLDMPAGYTSLSGKESPYEIVYPVRDSSASKIGKENYATRFTGYINIPSSGEWQFRVQADDNMWVFLDDMSTANVMAGTYQEAGTYTKTLSAGYKKIQIYFSNGGTAQYYDLKWRNKNAGISDYENIPNSAFARPASTILQKVTYATNDFIFVKDLPIEPITPTLVGPVKTWRIEPDLPPGVVFNNGIISGTPTIPYNRREYTITATNVVTVIIKISFGILDSNGNSLSRGVTGYYYSGDVECRIINLEDVPSRLSLKFVRYETQGVQFPSTAAVWDGLTNDFKNSFVAYWKGYLNIPETGDYTFYYEATDWSRLYIGSETLYYSNDGNGKCGTFRKSFTDKFNGGLTYFGILFGKGQNSGNKSHSLQWEHDSGNYPFSRKDVDFQYLLHVPEGYLEYTYKLAHYVSGIAIKTNEPIFFQAQSSKYNSFTCNPLLPSGIVINPQTGIISGTPTDLGVLETTYTITAKSTSDASVPTYTTQITFTVEQRFTPSNLVYPPIQTNIGEKLKVNNVEVNSVSPSLDNAIGVVYTLKSPLPTGLSLNPGTGEISGIPYEEWNKEVTIEASNPSGSTEANVKIVVTGCPGAMKFLRFEYTILNADVVVKLMNSGGISLHTGSGLVGFDNYIYTECNIPGIYNVTFERRGAASGGWFRLSMDNLVVYAANNTDGTYTTDVYEVDGNISPQPPTLKYPNPQINVIPGEVVSLCPSIQNGASKVEIVESGDFPEFLRFSEETGCIVGPTMGVSKEGISITVKATNPSGESSPTTVQIIGDQQCGGKKELAIFRFTCNNECPRCYYTFKSFSSSAYTISNAGNLLNHDRWLSSCVTLGAYQLAVGNSLSHAWTMDTNFYIYLGTQLLGTYRHDSTASTETKTVVSLTSYLTESSEWYFSSSKPNNDKWKSELDTSYMSNKYRAGLFPARTAIASYYGLEFNFYDSLEYISSLDLSVTHDSGIIIYLNGKEIYRNGLPIGLVTETTYGKRLVDTIAARTVVIPQMLIKYGKNYIAVECHRHRNSRAYDPFKASILPAASSEVQTGKCLLRTTMSGVQAYTSGSTYAGEEASKAIDNNHGTKTYVRHDLSDYPVNFDIYWPNKRAEYFNMYDFWTANDRWEYRNPTGWKIYGSSEYGTEDWELIDTQAYVNLPSANAVQTKFNLDNNYKAYNAFRFQVTGVKQPEGDKYNYQMADLLQYNCIPAYCPESEDGKWPSTAAGYTARIACPTEQSGWISRECKASPDGSTATWGSESSGCQQHATSVSYSATTFKVGFQSELIPTANGGVNYYYITCENGLPNGISFESETGILSGIAIVESDSEAKMYTCSVTATTGDGNELSASVNINVEFVYCESDNEYPRTKAGDVASIACRSGYTGNRTRKCSTTNERSWEEEDISQCKKLPPEFTVTKDSQVNTEFAVDQNSVVTLTASVISGREATTWTSTDPDNICRIAGGQGAASLTCTATDLNEHTITIIASNSDSSYSLPIKIKAFAAPGTIIYATTSFNVYKDIEVDCDTSYPKSGITVTGYTTSVTISPPDYIVSPISGCLKGIPKTIGTTQYTISVNGAPLPTPITVNVQQATCSLPGTGTVNAGEYYNATCAPPQIGTISRYCPLVYNPTLEDPIGVCEDPNPTAFYYQPSSVVAYTNVPITNLKPIITGNKNRIKYSVKSGSLPPGLELETDGSITGAITVEGSYTGLVISAFGNQEMTASLTFTVTTTKCRADPNRDLPERPAGSEVTKACPDGYNGQIIIRCPYTSNPTWGDEDSSGCTTPAPEVWGYESKDGYVTFSAGFHKSLPPKRTSGGMPTSFLLLQGNLPDGIKLNPTTGHLVGMSPVEFAPSEISIMGSNNVGKAGTKFKIRVVIAECPAEGEWEKTRAGGQAVLPCIDSSKVGQRSRQCPNVEDPKWESPIDTCKDDVPSFQYASKDVNVYWDVPFELSPIDVQGEPDSYSLTDDSPKLPLGLSLDETTGKISGKVSTSVPKGNEVYFIVAHNAQGYSIRQLVSLTIETFQCNGEGVWITTDYGSEAAILCPDGFIGTEVRPCNSFTLSGSVPTGRWGIPNNSSCVAVEDKTVPPAEKVFLKFEMSIPLKTKSDISGLHYQVFQQLVAKSLNSALNASGVIVKSSSILLDFIDEKTEEGENNLKVEVRIAEAEANAKKLASNFNPKTQIVMEEFNRLVKEGYTDLFGSTFISIDTSGEIEGPTANPSGDASTGTNVGMIIGLVVAGAAVLIIVAGCLYCRCVSKSVERKKRPTGKKKAAATAKADGKDGKADEKGTAAKKDGVRV